MAHLELIPLSLALACLTSCGQNLWSSDSSPPRDAEAGRQDGEAELDAGADADADGDGEGDSGAEVDADRGGEVAGPAAVVALLDPARFEGAVEELSAFGDRSAGSASFGAAADWLASQLELAGYVVERQELGGGDANLFATKVGERSPDRMYLIAAHLDGRGGGGAADDDGSGCALVLEAARAFGRAEVAVEVSVRFIFFGAEEIGLVGSSEYVAARAALQGVESPPGSGDYPEPSWLGIIQHDMLLFDHGLPPAAGQASGADVDVEYDAAAEQSAAARTLAEALVASATVIGAAYPAEVGADMCCTDSLSFTGLTAAVSVREDRRLEELGNGSNPHWHRPSDLASTYSSADLALGFAATVMTVGAVAELAGATVSR